MHSSTIIRVTLQLVIQVDMLISADIERLIIEFAKAVLACTKGKCTYLTRSEMGMYFFTLKANHDFENFIRKHV